MPEVDVGIVAKWLPRLFCLLSFIFNPLLIYLVVTQNKCKIGPYRQFLVCFALFDMTYSAVDVLVGMASHHYKYSFSVFVSHGRLVDNPTAGRIGLIVRCSFVCLSYGILEIHFIYRYIILCRPKLIHWFTQPLNIVGWFLFWLSFGIYWGIAMSLAYLDEEDVEYLRESFRVSYDVNIDDIGILGIRFNNIYTIPMLSAFPFCDPIAIIAIFAEYRAYILRIFGIKTAVKRVQFSTSQPTSSFQLTEYTTYFSYQMAEIDVGFVAKWLPRLFCILSFMFNPLLIYLVITQNKCKIGPYRQLLVCFALFDMTYSIVDVLVGMASHQYESSYSLFVSHGPLFEIDNSLNNSTISAAAKRVHRQLFLALIAQTAIPLLVSFLPCVIIWYTPLFGVNLGG
ncbi:unnamed protein product [Caenorhabditis auriculariae]|uniref:G-protein coupled receptors family 1 profile domain-containing protein n=1 Tax=Caenorhabditis auriculariae TaxID=2777116 RepID=A0A8S1HHD1_9PELO|nr:unnamed protein product [Caenorhabditis auriculariae]